MRQIIDDRELIVLDVINTAIRGTYHKTSDKIYGGTLNSTRQGLGVLFLNGMYVTRAANGDAAVYWADSLAECGYPSFRVDLPGFGDSEGDSPADWLGLVNSGGYRTIVAASIKEIVRRFDLSGIVIVGHCSGAVSALYAALPARVECKGLVLMDPYFYLSHASNVGVRQKLNIWALRGRVGRILSRGFDLLKQLRLSFRGNTLPANANIPLIRACKEMISSGLPMLVLTAPDRRATGKTARIGEFDYLKYVFGAAGRQHRITMKVLNGANHSFSNRRDRKLVREHIASWLNSTFSPGQVTSVAVSPGVTGTTRGRLTVESMAS